MITQPLAHTYIETQMENQNVFGVVRHPPAHLVTTLAPADVVNPVIEKIAVDQPVDGYGTTSLLDELC